ncbi:MAG: HEAT repeat domain-containing protein [Methanomicrobiaceae archaeon]|nr:HEAT repeat domain-containing protein [Methanomicrobiaceae archaeon]
MSKEIDIFLELLGSGNNKKRRNAIEGLKKIGRSASMQLLNALNSESPEVRDGAAEVLGSFSSEDIDTFMKLLVSGRENARDGAARTIGYIAGNGVNITAPLSKNIKDGEPEARKGAAVSIGYIPRPTTGAINMLLYLLRDDDREVRRQAAESLKKLKWSSKNPVEMSFYFLAEDNWKELGRIGTPALDAISFGLETGDSGDRVQIAGILTGIEGKISRTLLLSLLDDPEKSVRLAATDAIADTGDKEFLNYLVAAMDDSDYDIRVEASWALKKAGWIPENGYQKVKSLMLRGDFREVELMGEKALPFLIENLGDNDPDIRNDTIKILYSIGTPAYDALVKAKNSSSPAIRVGINEAIDYFSREDEKAGKKKDGVSVKEEEIRAYNTKEYWYNALISNSYNHEMAQRLSGALSDEDDIIRIAAVETLKGHGKKSVPVLVLLIKDESENVKTAAIEALGDLYAAEAIEPLVETIEDEHSQVRKASAYSLGKIRDKGTLPVLVRHFADPDEIVRNECSESVAKMGNIALPFLENLITHYEMGVRIASLMALGGIGDPSGIPFATKALNDPDNPVRAQAMDSLVQISNFMFIFLMNEIQRVSIQGTKMEKLGMLSVLSRLKDLKIIPVVKRFLSDDDEEVRRNAAEILEVYRTREVKAEKEKIREYSRETADLLKRKLSLNEIDRLLDRLISTDDAAAMEILGRKLSQDEISGLIRELSSKQKRDTAKILGNRLSQEEIDELIHRSAYVSNKNTTKLLGKKLSQEEIDDLINRASSDKDENAAKDIKKQLTQNEIDELIKKELALKKKVAMEVSRLIIGLKSKDTQVKFASAENIVKTGEPAVEPLMNFMSNSEPEFQKEVASLLIKIGKPGIRGMIRTLNYGKTEMRVVIAGTILKSRDEEAINAVYDRIRSEKNPEVKKALILAFTKDTSDKRIPDALHFALADKDPGVKALAVRLLGKIRDEKAIGPLISVFNYSEDALAELASKSLAMYGDKAIPVLLKELKGGSSDLFRERIADTLEKTGVKISDKNDLAWFMAAKSRWDQLEKLGSYAIEPLSLIITNPYSDKRVMALKTMIKIGGKEIILPLSKAIFDIDGDISHIAREGLLEMGKAAIPAINEIASMEKDPGHREELESLIDEIGSKDIILNSIKTGNWEKISGAGPAAIKYLSERTDSADPGTKREIVSAIVRIGGEESVSPMAELLFDNDEKIAAIARQGILNTGGAAIPLLEKISENTRNPARREVLKYLIREISREDEILSLVKGKQWKKLEIKGLDAIDLLSQLLEDPDPENRMGAVKVIAGIDDISSVRPLIHAFFDQDEEIAEKARMALNERGKAIIPVISVAIIKETNPAKKKALAGLISDIEKSTR